MATIDPLAAGWMGRAFEILCPGCHGFLLDCGWLRHNVAPSLGVGWRWNIAHWSGQSNTVWPQVTYLKKDEKSNHLGFVELHTCAVVGMFGDFWSIADIPSTPALGIFKKRFWKKNKSEAFGGTTDRWTTLGFSWFSWDLTRQAAWWKQCRLFRSWGLSFFGWADSASFRPEGNTFGRGKHSADSRLGFWR